MPYIKLDEVPTSLFGEHTSVKYVEVDYSKEYSTEEIKLEKEIYEILDSHIDKYITVVKIKQLILKHKQENL